MVATLGPACRGEAMLERLIAAGADVVRINMSHGEFSDHAQVIAEVRAVSGRLGVPVGIMIDLPGPKLRLGDLADPLALVRDERVSMGAGSALPLNRPKLLAHLRSGHRVLLDDGAIELVVLAIESADSTPSRALLRVVNGGVVTSRKGVNLPDTALPIPAVTSADEECLAFGLAHDVDFVAQSFVRQAEDVVRLKQLIAAGGGDQMVVAKIEKREALAALADIVAVADAIMVARGDLGVEIPQAEVPIWQKRIIRAAVCAGKPVITATQMLQSMMVSPRPTRAEVSDVANAIYDSTCAVMLSGETAAGAFPVESVATMAGIADAVEPDVAHGGRSAQEGESARADISGAITYGACDVARKVGAAAIVTATASGATARSVAKYRPLQPILSASPRARTVRQLTLAWGVTPVSVGSAEDVAGAVAGAVAQALATGILHPRDLIVITAGAHVEPGTADLIQVRAV